MEEEGKSEDIHKHCFRFPPDFDTGNIRYHHVARFLLGGGNETEPTSVVRVYMTPKGIFMFIPDSAIKRGHVIIVRDYDEGGALAFGSPQKESHDSNA